MSASLLLRLAALAAALLWWLAAAAEATLSAEPTPRHAAMARFGINLGGPSAWGAEQLLANVLANPGFEPVLDRALLTLGSVDGNRLREQDPWLKRSDGFWDRAEAEVLSGPAAGRRLRVLNYHPGANGSPAELLADQSLPGLRTGDVLSLLARSPEAAPPPRWWSSGRISLQPGTRPGGSGHYLARLESGAAHAAVLTSHLDTLERAGRLLPIDRRWRVAVWMRALNGEAQLRVRLAREGQTVHLDQTVQPGPQWQRLEWFIDGKESIEGRGPLSLSFSVGRGAVELDEAFLGEAEEAPGGFRQAVVDTLRALRPGYIRDWQGQLGDTAANRFAEGMIRQPVRYRPGDGEQLHTHSVPQVLALCVASGAQPWLILPPTLGETGAREFGQRLREALRGLPVREVLVEFGNENWNPLFQPAGLPDPARHAEVANHAFAALRAGYGDAPGPRLITLLNARANDAEGLRRLLAARPQAERIAVGPYFSYRLQRSDSLDQARAEAFAGPASAGQRALLTEAARSGLRLSAYELNFHTTEGDAPATLRNALVSGAASGPALASQLLAHALDGLGEQAVYALAGFDAFTTNRTPVRLFGITRDLAAPARWRPTGQALQMLNAVAAGSLHATRCHGNACNTLIAAVFREGGREAWAITHGGRAPAELRLTDACRGRTPSAQLLDGSDGWRSAELRPLAPPGSPPLRCDGVDALITLPPLSLVTVR